MVDETRQIEALSRSFLAACDFQGMEQQMDMTGAVATASRERKMGMGAERAEDFAHCRSREQALRLPLPTFDSVEGAVLDPSLGRVVVRIAPYPGMACGDRIVLSWRGLDIEGQPYHHDISRFISEAQLGREIVLVVRGAHVAALDGGSLEVFWTLTSASRPEPLTSLSRRLDVGDVRYSLMPVTLEDAVGGSLDPARVVDGTSVTVQPYAGMSAGDRVWLMWEGPAPEASLRDTLIVESFAVGLPLVLGIAPEFITPHLGGEVVVRYCVEQKSGATRESGATRISIAPLERGELAAPQVLEADDGVLSVEDAVDGVSVLISDARVEEGELVYLKCDGESFFHRDDREIISGMAMQPLVFIVPYRFWREHVGSRVQVSYSVERLDDVSQMSSVTLLRVQG
ncbi:MULTISPECIES: hypothetical protein [Pseudomonas]|uniref:Uncharacterized protein n=1 Tax=Pseudomonas aphyarum TaxID=2942629 RepID=A0ABT5PPY0_9PSED|nr:hypothetical protein [Pseudomonas aphyarum]MDD0971255.1 hypothetical protein [Pseudomonas aphyarum]MDD1125779.1 hypothetical protein [Pseudomonas aphyarum]